MLGTPIFKCPFGTNQGKSGRIGQYRVFYCYRPPVFAVYKIRTINSQSGAVAANHICAIIPVTLRLSPVLIIFNRHFRANDGWLNRSHFIRPMTVGDRVYPCKVRIGHNWSFLFVHLLPSWKATDACYWRSCRVHVLFAMA